MVQYRFFKLTQHSWHYDGYIMPKSIDVSVANSIFEVGSIWPPLCWWPTPYMKWGKLGVNLAIPLHQNLKLQRTFSSHMLHFVLMR